jgi:hypothetical protein
MLGSSNKYLAPSSTSCPPPASHLPRAYLRPLPPLLSLATPPLRPHSPPAYHPQLRRHPRCLTTPPCRHPLPVSCHPQPPLHSGSCHRRTTPYSPNPNIDLGASAPAATSHHPQPPPPPLLRCHPSNMFQNPSSRPLQSKGEGVTRSMAGATNRVENFPHF